MVRIFFSIDILERNGENMKMKNMICKRVAAGVLAFAVGSMALAGFSGAEQGDSGKNTEATMQKSEIGQKESGQDDKPSQTNVEQTEAKELEDKNAQNEREALGTIMVTYVKSPLNVPSIVEKDQKIFANAFEKLGYEVGYSDLTTGPEQTQALASGDIQFLYAVGATSVILAASNGLDIKIISTYSRSPKSFKLFAQDESIQSPEDLRGKKVAGPKGTILHELLVAYLASAGMAEADIEFVSMGIPDSQAALAGGSVDAALLAGPTAYNMEKDGYPVVTDGEGLTEATIVVAAGGKYIEEHPEEVKTFLAAQKEVLNYISEQEEQCMEITAKETELTVEAVKEMYPMYDFDMTIKDSDIEAMKKTEQFMKENQMIEQEVDIEGLIMK